MTITTFRDLLAMHTNRAMHWMLPDGDMIAAHYHITEVGRVQKDFIDCGGTTRSTTSCVLQLWVANDQEHRLDSSKLASILKMAQPLLKTDDLPVEVEYQQESIATFPIAAVEVTPAGLLFHLGIKQTDCLAPDRCGIPGAAGCC
jgi:hypothetical protein